MNDEKYTTVDLSIEACDVEVKQMDLSTLKTEINLFLFRWLPDGSTILEIEMMACTIHKMIENMHNKCAAARNIIEDIEAAVKIFTEKFQES